MENSLIVMASVIVLGILYVVVPAVFHTYRLCRGRTAVRCPETQGCAEIGIDAPHAAFCSAFGRPQLRVKQCTLWPEQMGCAGRCLVR